MARQCKFKWVSAPPVTPLSALEDELHVEWNDIRETISKRLNALDELNVISKFPGLDLKRKNYRNQ